MFSLAEDLKMNSLSEMTWQINSSLVHDFPSIFSSNFDVGVSDVVPSVLTFLDDFDSHLWKAGYLFYKTSGQEFTLIDPTGKLREIKASNGARFWWDFSGEKKVLQKLIGLRAVIPVISVKLTEQEYLLRNEDQKIVVKACLTKAIVENTTVHYLTLSALRGYKKYFNRAEKSLDNVIDEKINHFGLKTILMNHAAKNFETDTNFEIPIDADMPAEDSVRIASLGLLNSAKLHVSGAVKDIDTEFLHQYRVNFRKLRSLTSLLKKSLPQATVAMLKEKLSMIVGKTNRLRDLDVFLLDEENYRALLPENFNSGLSELYTLVRTQRKEEQKKVANYFSSKIYASEISACAEELSLSSTYEMKAATQPILKVAKKLLINRYHKMLAMSATTNSQSADDDVHALRIEFKKFRYLIEFFIDLLPQKDTAKLVGEVKKIQTVLGNFNDYATQISFLQNYINDDRIEMSKSLSGLIAVLHQKQVEEKCKVTNVLANFFTEKMTDKIDVIFGSTKQGDSV